jgi:hypothetical protein
MRVNELVFSAYLRIYACVSDLCLFLSMCVCVCVCVCVCMYVCVCVCVCVSVCIFLVHVYWVCLLCLYECLS